MKLTIAMAVALVLCGISLVAHASIARRHAVEVAAQIKADAAENTLAKISERLALNGLDARLMFRLHRLATHKTRG